MLAKDSACSSNGRLVGDVGENEKRVNPVRRRADCLRGLGRRFPGRYAKAPFYFLLAIGRTWPWLVGGLGKLRWRLIWFLGSHSPTSLAGKKLSEDQANDGGAHQRNRPVEAR